MNIRPNLCSKTWNAEDLFQDDGTTMTASHFCFLAFLLLLVPIDAINVTELDCRMRLLALDYAKSIQAWRFRCHRGHSFTDILWDALELTTKCHAINRHHFTLDECSKEQQSHAEPSFCQSAPCLFVDARHHRKSLTQNGSQKHPYGTLRQALISSRRYMLSEALTIVLRGGIHTLEETISLGIQDSGLTIRGYPGEDVWMSGGIGLQNVQWTPLDDASQILVADLSQILLGRSLPKVAALFSEGSRYVRARYPNSNPERDQWGYASTDNLKYSIPANVVLEWHLPPPGSIPTFDYIDFSRPSPNFPVKNDSAMPGYNLYASGRGGVCGALWGPKADSYWCSNASAGGWAEVDQDCAMRGQLQIPSGMTYNRSHPIGQRIHNWTGDAVGGFVYAWHSQSWSMHMFEVESVSDSGDLLFSPGGGRQGGRNWCRCDQCTYAGPWCGQHQDPPDDTDQRLISGTWLFENVLTELDSPGEFYFDPISNLLYVYPNASSLEDLRFAMLETLVSMENAHNVSIINVNFRDAAPTFMGEWSAPSGGDWALHRGGAIFLQNVSYILIRDCIFRRIDGNAIFLSGKTWHVTIQRSDFEWIGENAIATWGDTESFNATNGDQPMHTLVEQNVMRELGIYQKQSSAWGQAKAALNTIRNNIMFNMPRAAVNFNDMMGGGDVVESNLIFNTCRESGDHGPINTWDRQPFLTTLRDGTPSFIPIMRTIAYNFIVANYGASESVDNDDGSSWYHIHHNLWHDSEGFKMDYGGHDSVFEHNIIISYPATFSQYCIGFGSFYTGHGHTVRNNSCIVPRGDAPLSFVQECIAEKVSIMNNAYYSPNGTALFECGNEAIFTLEQVQESFGLELGSTASPTPSVDTIIHWSKHLLFMELESSSAEISLIE
jgi:hypothetical protein